MSRLSTTTASQLMAATAAPTAAAQSAPLRELKPTPDQIQKRAYQLFLERTASGKGGTPENDWLQAERELTVKR